MLLVAGMTTARCAAEDSGGYSIPQRFVLVDPATGLAIGGYDPVAYFVDRRPRLGKPHFELLWSQTIWRFVNEGNMAAFKDTPEIYAPQFGGHDARAMVDNSLASGDPSVWAIYHQRLYLFYSPARRFFWLVTPERHIRQAKEKWDKRLNFTLGDRRALTCCPQTGCEDSGRGSGRGKLPDGRRRPRRRLGTAGVSV
ncbi:YHS domain-containing (seleno)protein [Breoghania sp.]|uniref:YHS domain-containing (seleno)protein n=1 Tax=Breoghania sp. TaxID=2065378 RepID=UPI0026380BCD|nr:YHS domain-containing (seleno)protein [Breoghania sp.]